MSRKKQKNYSFISLLKSQKNINNSTLGVLAHLSLEEIIAVKLELSIQGLNNKMYNFPLWSAMPNITRDALLRYAMAACTSKRDMARFLGIPINKFNDILKKYNTEKLYNHE